MSPGTGTDSRSSVAYRRTSDVAAEGRGGQPSTLSLVLELLHDLRQAVTTPRTPETVRVMRIASTTSAFVAPAASAIGTCALTAAASPIEAFIAMEMSCLVSWSIAGEATGDWIRPLKGAGLL